MTEEQPNRDRVQTDDRFEADCGRRTFLTVGGGIGATMLAGCASEGLSNELNDDTPTDGPVESGHDGNFRLLISDLPADIGDFDRLDVTFDYARIFDGGEGEESNGDDEEESDDEQSAGGNETDDGNETDEPNDAGFEVAASPENGEPETDEPENGNETETETDEEDEPANEDEKDEDEKDESTDGVERERGFYILDLEGATVDLTEVIGEKAVSVFEGELSPGTYQKIELHVAEVEGIVDGEQANVKVPSGKLQITHSFEISEDGSVDFVFDINVVKRGQGNDYNLNPVISESGVAGEDVDVEEVDDEEEEEDEGDEDEDEEEVDDEDDEEEEEDDEEDNENDEEDENGEEDEKPGGPPENPGKANG